MSNAYDPDSQLAEDVQEAHRVRPPRRRDNHASAGRQHVVTGNGRGYLLQHNFMLPGRDMLARRNSDVEGSTYFPVHRATSQREDDAKTPYARIQNLGVRFVVQVEGSDAAPSWSRRYLASDGRSASRVGGRC